MTITNEFTKNKPVSITDLIVYLNGLDKHQPVNLIQIANHFNPNIVNLSDTFIQLDEAGDGLDIRELTNMIGLSVCMDTMDNFDNQNSLDNTATYFEHESNKLYGYVYAAGNNHVIQINVVANYDIVDNQTYVAKLKTIFH